MGFDGECFDGAAAQKGKADGRASRTLTGAIDNKAFLVCASEPTVVRYRGMMSVSHYSADKNMTNNAFAQTTNPVSNGLAQRQLPLVPHATHATVETTFQTLLNQTSQLIWLLDTQGNVLRANQTALAFNNTNLALAMGKPVCTSWPFSAAEQVRLRAAIAAAAEGRTIRYDAILQGEDRPVSLNLTLREIERPAQSSFVLIEGQEVGDRKQTETNLLRYQRVQSVGSMTAGIVHDLNNLLTPLVGGAHLLHREFPDADQKQKELFKIIDASASRAKNLVGQYSYLHRRQHRKQQHRKLRRCRVRSPHSRRSNPGQRHAAPPHLARSLYIARTLARQRQ